MDNKPLLAAVLYGSFIALDGLLLGTTIMPEVPAYAFPENTVQCVKPVVLENFDRLNDGIKNKKKVDTKEDQIKNIINVACQKHQIDCNLVHAVVSVESNYKPHVISSDGAVGLMQLVPTTARHYGVSNPLDPRQNIDGGIRYLKYLLSLFGNDAKLAIAAYNAGPARVLKVQGVPKFKETQRYVRLVMEAKELLDRTHG